MGPSTQTSIRDLPESMYQNLESVEKAVLEETEFRDLMNPETNETHYRVAVTDGEKYTLSTPLNQDKTETIEQGLREAADKLEEGTPLEENLGGVGEYLAQKY
ncbi:MAG: hypothetical protein ABEI78_00390 [Candidatus Nanohaloarchaea archaeon]